jgi:hypothetical protein
MGRGLTAEELQAAKGARYYGRVAYGKRFVGY